jgi:hypothetical protein
MTDNTDKIDHNRVVQTAQVAATKRRTDLYERAYLAALTGLLANSDRVGSYDEFNKDARIYARAAVHDIERYVNEGV